MQINLKEKTAIELKAIAYDILTEQQRLNHVLTSISQELLDRTKVQEQKTEIEPVTENSKQ